MKRSIAFHKECLENMKHTLTRAKLQMQAMEEDIYSLEARIHRRQSQIEEAKRIGKMEFDADKFHTKNPSFPSGGKE